ncbi:hypothetical protein COLO4_35476 [Corchorus olitorius]|uniref:Uncharacterized protein n=1 Tax=Corchorus olitorius TaxID=93759 RepID=A0A1R3GGN0_9ROSI|nr:hypothetical protein COLO4_35476 [Corchorus olitorius]
MSLKCGQKLPLVILSPDSESFGACGMTGEGKWAC